jgi:hypothetical protein
MNIQRLEDALKTAARSGLDSLRWNWYRWNCPLLRKALQNTTPRQLLYSINISPRYRYVYLDNPKTGCSSLKSALVELELRDAGSDLDCYDWKAYHNPNVSPLRRLTDLGVADPLSYLASSGFRFVTFVRNPYDRLVSGYRDKILRNRPQKREILRALGYAMDALETPVSFEDFVRAVVVQTDYEMNPHWRVQASQTLYELLEFSFVGRFERYEADFAAFFQSLGLPPEQTPSLRHLNPSGERDGFKGYFTDELRALVYQRYKQDFDYFGYSQDLPNTL